MLSFTNNKTSTQNGLSYARGFALCNGSAWSAMKPIVLVVEGFAKYGNNNAYVESFFSETNGTNYGVCAFMYPYSNALYVRFRNAAGTTYDNSATTAGRIGGWYRYVLKISHTSVKMWDRSGALTVTANAPGGTPITGSDWLLGLNRTDGAGGALWGAIGAGTTVFDNTGDQITDAMCLAMAAVPQSLSEETTKGRGKITALRALYDNWALNETSKNATLTVGGAPTEKVATAVGTATSVVLRLPIIDAPSTMPDATWDMADARDGTSIYGDNGEDGSTAAFNWPCALSLGTTLAASGTVKPAFGDVFGRGGVFEVHRDVGTGANGHVTTSSGGPVLVGQGTVLMAMRFHGVADTSGTRSLFQIGSTNSFKLGITTGRLLAVNGSAMSDGNTAYLPATPFFLGFTCDGTTATANIDGQIVTKSSVTLAGGNGTRADDFYYLGRDLANEKSPSSTIYSIFFCTNYKYAACVAALRTLVMQRHGFRTGNPTSLGVLYGTSRMVIYGYRGNTMAAQLAEAYWAGAEIHNCGQSGALLADLSTNFASICNASAMINRVSSRANRWIVVQGGDNERGVSSAVPPWDTTAPGVADADWITAAAASYVTYKAILTAAATNYGKRIGCTVIPRGDLIDTGNNSRNFHGVRYYFNLLVTQAEGADCEAVADMAAALPFTIDTALASITQAVVQAAINPSGPDLYNSFDTYLHLIGQQGNGQDLFGVIARNALAASGATGFTAAGAAAARGINPRRSR